MENKNTSEISIEKKPDESAGVFFTSHLKIVDVETKEVLVQQRAD